MNQDAAIFDPQNFLDGSTGGANSTKRLVVPAATYPAFISDLKSRNGTVKKEGENFGKPWTTLEVSWQIDDGGILAATMEQQKVVVFQSIMLEFSETGALADGKGKNVKLGRLREAIGLNDGPVPWRSFVGRPAVIKVEHEIYEGEPQARVTAVAKR